MMKMKKHFSILLNAALSAVLAIGLSACSEDFNLTNDNPDPNPDKPINFDDYPTRFGTGDVVAAAKEMLSGPFKISTDYNMKWYWTYGDKIWVDTAEIVNGAKVNGGNKWIKDDVNDIPKPKEGEKLTTWANFYMGAVLKGDHYEVRYTGNDLDNTAGTGNGLNPNQVTIAAHQIQSAPGNSLHIGKYGDCGVDTSVHSETTTNRYHKFNLHHKAAYAIFTPRLDSIEQKDSFALTIGSIPLKSITFTKTDATGQICGTYDFHPVDGVVKLDVPNVTNPGKTIKLETTGGILGKTKDENKAYYMVLQPGQHNFNVTYEFDYPEYNGKTGEIIETTKASRILSKNGGYKFSENGFTKVNHKIQIPAYRERYTYYTWGASANYHSVDSRTNNSKAYPLTDGKKTILNDGEVIFAGYPKASDTNSRNIDITDEDDVAMGYDRKNFHIGAETDDYGNVTSLRQPIAIKMPIYTVIDKMPLWGATPTDTAAGFYNFDSGGDTPGINGTRSMEPPFLTANYQGGTRVIRYMYGSKNSTDITYIKGGTTTRTAAAGTIYGTIHQTARSMVQQYRSITRMPSANEMTWYLSQDFYVDTISPWLAADKNISDSDKRRPLVRGGVWFKKSDYRTAQGFSTETNHLKNGTDLRTNYESYEIGPTNVHFKYGIPSDTSQYFFIPFLGYYHTSATKATPTVHGTELKYYGARGYYWTRTQKPGDDRCAYYLEIAPNYVKLHSDMAENKKHGMVGNERPDWQRKMPKEKRLVADAKPWIDDKYEYVMQNDWWFQ